METAKVTSKTKWAIDPVHSELSFKVRHLVVATVRGTFKEYDSSIYTTDEDFMTSEIDVWINPATISTGDEKRDEHLRSADFFDAETYKEINFIGNTYEQADNDNNYILYGDLTMKGITKQIKLNVHFNGVVKDPWGNHKAVFTIDGKISRADWGLTWNTALETGGVLVSDEVVINCEIQLMKTA